MNTIVPFEGPTDAKIYIVGEAPGAEEEAQGRPFVGSAGRILDKLLMDVGIVRSECRLANVMRIRPPTNNFAHFYVDKQMHIPKPELIEGRKYLLEDIKKCRPNVVCALGNEALMALFSHRNITDWRGSILWHHRLNVKVIPTVHPAMIMRQWDFAPLVLFDLRKVKEESETPKCNIPNRDFILAPTFEQVMCELVRLQKCKKIAFDIETEGTIITAIAFADSPFSAICIPFTFSKGTETINYWPTIEEEIAVMNEIKKLMEDEKIEKIAQNAQFDCVIFAINPPYINTKNLVMDTMCAHHTIYPELPKGLEVLCSIYTRQPYYKHWAKTGSAVDFWKYNAMDACIAFETAIAIEKEMKEFGVYDFYYKLVHPLIPILTEMQIRGVKVDNLVRLQANEECLRKVAETQNRLNELVGRQVNVVSPKQLKQLFYEEMKLPPRISRVRGTETTDEEAIEALAAQYPNEVFDLILTIRKNLKLLGTYLTDEGERIRCSYLIGGTKTGRLSSRESVFGTGSNLQNIPKGICRKMFVADEGKVFIEADLSQAEARIVAYLSGEEKLINLFEKGGDIHAQVAEWIGVDRELAKRLVHGSNYGIGVRTFAYHAQIKESKAREVLQKYFDTFPKIKMWQLQIQAHLSKTRIMETPMGRKRLFFGRWGEQLFREAYSYIPQSTVADVLNLAIINLKKSIPNAEIMLQIHDAFVVQCAEGEVNMYADAIKEIFKIPLTINNKTFTIPVEIKTGKNWDEMHKR